MKKILVEMSVPKDYSIDDIEAILKDNLIDTFKDNFKCKIIRQQHSYKDFKIGDKVVVNTEQDEEEFCNEVGVIVYNDVYMEIIGIKFEEYHEHLHNLDGYYDSGNCWWFDYDKFDGNKIKRINEEK